MALDGIRNFVSNNGIQKTVRDIKAGNYWDAVKSGTADVLDLLGGISTVRQLPVLKNHRYIEPITELQDIPQASNNGRSYVVNVGLTKDYSKSPSLFAKRLDSGGAERAGYPTIALPQLHSGTGPHMNLVRRGNDHLIGKSLGTYIEEYTPTQETSGQLYGISRIDLGSNHPVLDNSAIPRRYLDVNPGRFIDDMEQLSDVEKRDVLDHELHHTIDLIFRGPSRQYSPMGKFIDFSKLDKGPDPNYFRDRINVNGSSWNEVAPRVTQLKNFLGINNGKTLMTPEGLKRGFEKYLQSKRFDNDMSTLYNAITDWKEFAKWVNSFVPSIGAYAIIRDEDDNVIGNEKVNKYEIY